jgi:hypothetical protein
MATSIPRPEMFEPLSSPPSTPKKVRPEPVCPPAPKRPNTHLTIKSGDLRRFFLNLEEMEKNSILSWDDPLDNLYYICEFTEILDENKNANTSEIAQMKQIICSMQEQIENIHSDLELEDSQVDVHMMDFNMRNQEFLYLYSKIKYIAETAKIVESS